MISRSTLRCLLGLAVAATAAACADARSTPGDDPMTRTQATTVTWTDGKPALRINCQMPGDCQNRAIAMCSQTYGNYTVLQMTNMPLRGDATVVRGPASVVVRCA